jgi:acyl-coenzyme A thioesterase PaaI-like protein
VERSGRTVAFTTAQLFDANGKLVASGSSSLAVFAEPIPA